MMEDGTAPPDPVVIETVCNGSPHSEGYTDTKGYFSIELGARNGVIQDASEFSSFGSMSRRGHAGCAARGYSADSAVPSTERKVHGLRSAGQTGGVPLANGADWRDGARWTIPMSEPFCCIASDPPKRARR